MLRKHTSLRITAYWEWIYPLPADSTANFLWPSNLNSDKVRIFCSDFQTFFWSSDGWFWLFMLIIQRTVQTFCSVWELKKLIYSLNNWVLRTEVCERKLRALMICLKSWWSFGWARWMCFCKRTHTIKSQGTFEEVCTVDCGNRWRWNIKALAHHVLLLQFETWWKSECFHSAGHLHVHPVLELFRRV